MIELTDATRQRVRRVFDEAQWEQVEKLLREQCGTNLLFVQNSLVDLAERIRFAVLKLSQGDLTKLQRAIWTGPHF